MAFEVKYDKNGMPIKEQNVEADLKAKAAKAMEPILAQAGQPEQEIQPDAVETIEAVADNQETTEATVDNVETVEPVKVEPLEVSKSKQETESAQAKNFRALREKSEKIERERDEALRRLAEYSQQKQIEQPEDLEFNVGDDDLAEGKHLKKVDKKLKRLEEQLRSSQAAAYQLSVEAKLKSQFPDFDKVVSKDNVESLRAAFPEIAESLNSTSDLYTKAISAYTLIKRLGIAPEEAPAYQNDRAIAIKNAAKPKPTNSVSPQHGQSPLQRANAFAEGLTDDLKSTLLKEMAAARKLY